MAQDYIKRTIDINGTIDKITVKQYDNKSRVLHLTIKDKDKPKEALLNLTDHTVQMYCETAFGLVEIDGEIINGPEGTVSFILPKYITDIPGRISSEVVLSNSDDTVISTPLFCIEVIKSVRDTSDEEITGQATEAEAIQVAVTAYNNTFGQEEN